MQERKREVDKIDISVSLWHQPPSVCSTLIPGILAGSGIWEALIHVLKHAQFFLEIDVAGNARPESKKILSFILNV
jgi:hypothetical protein